MWLSEEAYIQDDGCSSQLLVYRLKTARHKSSIGYSGMAAATSRAA
jgi:hypothetical protein